MLHYASFLKGKKYIPSSLFLVNKTLGLNWLLAVSLTSLGIKSYAYDLDRIAITLEIVDLESGAPLDSVDIRVLSRDFIDLKGLSDRNGQYSTVENPLSHHLKVGNRLEIRCAKKGYEPVEVKTIVAMNRSDRYIKINMQKSTIKKIYLMGFVLDEDTKAPLDSFSIKVNSKSTEFTTIKTGKLGYLINMPSKYLIDPEEIELNIFREGYYPKRLKLGIPQSGNIPSVDILLQKLKTSNTEIFNPPVDHPEHKIASFLPYLGHFTRTKNEEKLGISILAVGGAALISYPILRVQEQNFRNEALEVFNQTSKINLLSKADLYRSYQKYSIITFASVSVTSALISIIKNNKKQEPKLGINYTRYYNEVFFSVNF